MRVDDGVADARPSVVRGREVHGPGERPRGVDRHRHLQCGLVIRAVGCLDDDPQPGFGGQRGDEPSDLPRGRLLADEQQHDRVAAEADAGDLGG